MVTAIVLCPICRASSILRPAEGQSYEESFFAARDHHERISLCPRRSSKEWGFLYEWGADPSPRWIKSQKSKLVYDKNEGVHRLVPIDRDS
jgi:hypothetical protein